MALISKAGAKRLLERASVRWPNEAWDSAPWWLENERGVLAWFQSCAVGVDDCLAVPVNGSIDYKRRQPVAWLLLLRDKVNFDCRAVGLGLPGSTIGTKDLIKRAGKDLVHWSEPMKAYKTAEQDKSRKAVLPGDRVAMALGDGIWCIARAVKGWPGVSVKLAPDSEPIDAGAIASHWFVVKGRDQAFDALWNSGETRFNHYFAMIAKLRGLEMRLNPQSFDADVRRRGKRKAAAEA